MKRTLFVLLTMMTLIFTSCSGSLNPTVLAETTQENVEQSKEENNDVFKEIQRNIDLVASLRTKVEEAQINNKELPLKETLKDLKTITLSYERLASEKDTIHQSFVDKMNNLKDIQKKVNSEISTLNERRNNYALQLQSIATSNSETSQTRKKALTKAIEYVDTQKQLWAKFNNLELQISVEMINTQKRIENFLAVIDSSAILFREGLNLLQLQQDINEALSLFTVDVPIMDALAKDMESSWNNLDFLVESLTSLTVNLN